jgi:hypothetical protein
MSAEKQTQDATGEQPVSFEDFLARAQSLFDEAAAGRAITVERDGTLFRLAPVRRRRKPRPFTLDDPLLDIIGIGHSEGPTDVSSNKHKYIADAIASHFERSSAEPTTSQAQTSEMPASQTSNSVDQP